MNQIDQGCYGGPRHRPSARRRHPGPGLEGFGFTDPYALR